jgi:hypothetical protein
METETRLDKMSREMENVYQTKVEEKLQKLEENKQNVNSFFIIYLFIYLIFLAFENSRNISIKYSTRRRKN